MRYISKKLSSLILTVFVLNTVFSDNAFALSPTITSSEMGESARADTRQGMYALGQKRVAEKVGPGAIDFDLKPKEFVKSGAVGYLSPAIKFVNADYANPPAAWANNPILKETDLIKALEYFRDNEAKISPSYLEIREGYFEVDEAAGELPIARIEHYRDGRMALIVHSKFVQMWGHIRKNDIWFQTDFEVYPGSRRVGKRVTSVAWGVFYRLAKHEMVDKRKQGGTPKGGGHLYGLSYNASSEEEANAIGGRYSVVNDAIWMWFLGSYAFANSTRYDNTMLIERLIWLFSNDETALEIGFRNEFPIFCKGKSEQEIQTEVRIPTILAADINYHFFSRPGIEVPKTEISEALKDQYNTRLPSIYSVLPATGNKLRSRINIFLTGHEKKTEQPAEVKIESPQTVTMHYECMPYSDGRGKTFMTPLFIFNGKFYSWKRDGFNRLQQGVSGDYEDLFSALLASGFFGRYGDVQVNVAKYSCAITLRGTAYDVGSYVVPLDKDEGQKAGQRTIALSAKFLSDLNNMITTFSDRSMKVYSYLRQVEEFNACFGLENNESNIFNLANALFDIYINRRKSDEAVKALGAAGIGQEIAGAIIKQMETIDAQIFPEEFAKAQPAEAPVAPAPTEPNASAPVSPEQEAADNRLKAARGYFTQLAEGNAGIGLKNDEATVSALVDIWLGTLKEDEAVTKLAALGVSPDIIKTLISTVRNTVLGMASSAGYSGQGNFSDIEKYDAAQEALDLIQQQIEEREKHGINKQLVIGLGDGTAMWQYFLPGLNIAIRMKQIPSGGISVISPSPEREARCKSFGVTLAEPGTPIDIAIDGDTLIITSLTPAAAADQISSTGPVEEAASRTKPGKSPEDAKKVIMLSNLALRDEFTLKQYMQVYEETVKAAPGLGFESGISESTARSDLYALVKEGTLNMTPVSDGGAYKFSLKKEIKERVKLLRRPIRTAWLTKSRLRTQVYNKLEHYLEIKTIGDLLLFSRHDLGRTWGIGSISLDAISDGLAVLGLQLPKDNICDRVPADNHMRVSISSIPQKRYLELLTNQPFDESLFMPKYSITKRPTMATIDYSKFAQYRVEKYGVSTIIDRIINIGVGKGPGALPELRTEERLLVWKAANQLNNERIRVLIPQKISSEGGILKQFVLTSAVKKTIRGIQEKTGWRGSLTIDSYTQANLADILSEKSDAKKILITEDGMAGIVEDLLHASPEYFVNTRLFSMNLPPDYSEMHENEKSVCQIRAITLAILMRLYNEGDVNTAMILKTMLKDRLPDGVAVEEFVNNIPEKEGEDKKPDVVRLQKFIAWKVNLVEMLGKQLRLLQEFVWSAA